jgi:hypothetical protein
MKKAAQRRLFNRENPGVEVYFFSPVPLVAVPAPAPASIGAAVVPAAGAEAAAAGAEASAAGAGAAIGADAGAAMGAGAGAGATTSSFLPQAARATAATMAARARDLFIWMILEMNEKNNFRKSSKKNSNRQDPSFA